ncbi:MAG: universal stress protein [Candidatus Thermoplasmatota archaeon]|nr:universal stress protein [Candidatus Thermoplasmatota archaeon]
MNDIKRIIIPVDNSENSKKAVEKGAYFAKILGVEAKIITVNDTHQFISSVVLEDKLKKESQVFLDNFKKIAETLGIKIETQLITGKPAEEIIRFAKQGDLIIMAHHDQIKGIDKVIEKSVSHEVVQRAPCSVFIVK